jgi:hypothetical protein
MLASAHFARVSTNNVSTAFICCASDSMKCFNTRLSKKLIPPRPWVPHCRMVINTDFNHITIDISAEYFLAPVFLGSEILFFYFLALRRVVFSSSQNSVPEQWAGDGNSNGSQLGVQPVTEKQITFAKKLLAERGLGVLPTEALQSRVAMSAFIDSLLKSPRDNAQAVPARGAPAPGTGTELPTERQVRALPRALYLTRVLSRIFAPSGSPWLPSSPGRLPSSPSPLPKAEGCWVLGEAAPRHRQACAMDRLPPPWHTARPCETSRPGMAGSCTPHPDGRNRGEMLLLLLLSPPPPLPPPQ